MDPSPHFKALEQEISPFKSLMARAADTILVQDVSNYPIFVVHKNLLDIGINIVDKEKTNGNWSVNASTLEEFVVRQLISAERLEDFKLLYSGHTGDLCLFVLSDQGANFIFVPR
jgi:hypothetical protein